MKSQEQGLFPPTVRRATATPATRAARQMEAYPIQKRPRRTDLEEEDESVYEPPRPHTSARLYPASRTSVLPERTRVLPQRHFRAHWLLFVGIAMVVMMIGWLALSALESWWTTQQDDWKYGRPRTYQTDYVVGHGDSSSHQSHFIAMNFNRQVIVIEIPGGDTSEAQIYIGPTLMGDGQDLTPVTISFQDVNGDGKPDMLIHIMDQAIVFINNGQKFFAPGQQH